MNGTVETISWAGMLIAFIPVAFVVLVMHRWSIDAPTAVYATARMIVQLSAVGYVLVYVLETESPALVAAVLTFMLVVASWIALRPLQTRSRRALLHSLAAITVGSLTTLAIVIWGVIGVDPWFSPRYVVPLAGMIFSSSMNAVSLAAERLEAERRGGHEFAAARRTALRAALIPVVNSMFAVGLVSLPGMMTGQILSGVSPVVAVKYQVVVMAMLFGASGVSAALYLLLTERRYGDPPLTQ